MQIFFKTRTLARSFAKGSERTLVDNRSTTQLIPTEKNRWGVELAGVKNRQNGFTLIEILIVMAIIAILSFIVAGKFFG